MFDRLDDGARRVLYYARYEAAKLGSPFIRSEHLLLGILAEPSVRDALRSGQVSIPEVVAEVHARGECTPDTQVEEIPLHEDAQRVPYLAIVEAKQLADAHVGPEHVLAGLVRHEGCLAGAILSGRGLDAEQARDHVRGARPKTDSQPKCEGGKSTIFRKLADRVVNLAVRGSAPGRAEPPAAAHATPYLVVIEETPNGFSVYAPDLPGCVATGRDRAEAEREMKGASELHLQGLRTEGLAIPEPRASVSYVEVPA